MNWVTPKKKTYKTFQHIALSNVSQILGNVFLTKI